MHDDKPQSPKEAEEVQARTDETLAGIVDEVIRATDSHSMLLSEMEDSRVFG